MIYKISNYVTYNKGMASSIADKCWWIDSIPDNIDTVIDYGCATGELFAYLETKYPNRFKHYIGIDNDNKMLEVAKSLNLKNASFYTSLNKVEVNGPNTILIWNSVIHEILAYNGEDFLRHILSIAKDKKIYAVAIRDMFYSNNFNDETTRVANEFISRKQKPKTWYSHKVHCRCKNKCRMLQEYLLKYRYTENWDREVRERYLWDWDSMVKNMLPNYCTRKEFTFSIPQQRANIKRELHIDWNVDTHKKMLLICG